MNGGATAVISGGNGGAEWAWTYVRQVATGLTIALLGGLIVGMFNLSTRVTILERDVVFAAEGQRAQTATLARIEEKVDRHAEIERRGR